MGCLLVTGGAGYVGSHAVRELVRRGEKVVVLDDLSAGRVELEELNKDELPETMKGMSPAEQQTWLAEQGRKREGIQKEINTLLAEREAYIAAETKKRIEAGQGNSFDLEVARIIQEQGRKKGIRY